MSLDFSNGGYESLFKNALRNGINLFCGAGFSVEAWDKSGKKLPIGSTLLTELKKEFPSIQAYTKLPQACTKLTKTEKADFYSFLSNRFSVNGYNELYNSLLDIRLLNIYTTNIDDLFFRIFENSVNCRYYLNEIGKKGPEYDDSYAVNYHPLHGCIRDTGDYVFGATEIASAFSTSGNEQSWNSLAKVASKNAILFWGWNFADSGPIEAMYNKSSNIDSNTDRWVLLYSPDEETIDFLKSLGFNIIVGSTMDMLEYIEDFSLRNFDDDAQFADRNTGLFDKYKPPRDDEFLPSHQKEDFFLEYSPQWSHIYSGEIPKLSFYNTVADKISRGLNVIVTGIRASGKTTLMMQLLVNFRSDIPKHYMIAPSFEQAKQYIRLLDGNRGLIFIDDCFRDTNACIELMKTVNLQVVGFDRDFNYERQYYRIQDLKFELCDITEIGIQDAQSILNAMPSKLKRPNASTKSFGKDPTIVAFLASNMQSLDFRFMDKFAATDIDAARVFLMIIYVHSCGTPCSFDMIYSYLGDDNYKWDEMFDIISRAGKLINDITNSIRPNKLPDSIQNYYECRTRFLAEKIINAIKRGNPLFAEVLSDFAKKVPPFKICMFDKFRRSAFDSEYAYKAFPNIDDGKKYYETCLEKDESEYIYQQAALYFSRCGDNKTAFSWIDKAKNLMHHNRFSIDNTYAQIYFDANLKIDIEQSRKALDIMSNCCTNDKRKSIHFSSYAQRCLAFYKRYGFAEAESYIVEALEFVNEGIGSTNNSLGKKNKAKLFSLKQELESILLKEQTFSTVN